MHPSLVPRVGTGSLIGVGGTDKSYSTRVSSLRLGSTLASETSGAFADRIDAGNVGLALLRKFTVTFDFANHALYSRGRGCKRAYCRPAVVSVASLYEFGTGDSLLRSGRRAALAGALNGNRRDRKQDLVSEEEPALRERTG